MVDIPIRVQKLNRRKEFFAAQIQEERDRRNKFASSSSSGVGHFPSLEPSSEIPQLASVVETSLQFLILLFQLFLIIFFYTLD